jgi:hypothetical protein
MHPVDHYETLRRGREELLRQAEYERMARIATVKQARNWTLYRKAVNWLGTHLVRRGEKHEQFGEMHEQFGPLKEVRHSS